ncbi:uncharacterized protein A4U43_C01F1450 [Asparagus officinalis]|uniref:Uncharacterized protein n=1 Tax=Asparagus officinalis TaxID=4686 RepID=A0A5P1FQH2_ASPOF|nr:uncharacterized protein LOC109845928 [Asparagus officinalis]ONK78961.1 uncharacterized protein A4U43_C01F1450 [Asparagus officinalis]
MITRGRAILGLRNRLLNGDGSPISRAIALANVKRKASNSWSAVQDTYFSTKEIFENHRVVFTVGTSIASILTAWAGYSLRQMHQANIDKRLGSIEEAMKKNYSVEHEEIRKIVSSGNVSTAACIATAGTSLVLGYGLGWRGGAWFTKRKFHREQLKLLGQIKPNNRWQILRRPFVRLRKLQTSKKTAEQQSTRSHESSTSSAKLCSKPSSNLSQGILKNTLESPV